MRKYIDGARLVGMTFGIEVEYTGVSRATIARCLAEELGGTYHYSGAHLSDWHIVMPDGRKWVVESDCSVTGSGHGGQYSGTGGEVVSPVLTIADMDMVQKVVRRMRKEGARTDASCGGHIHVGAKDMEPAAICRLVKLFYKNEELIYKMARVRASRLGGYSHRLSNAFVDKIANMVNPTMDKINAEWFYEEGHGQVVRHHSHYTHCRYRALNLTNLWPEQNGKCKGTVEFRLFEGCGVANSGKLHAGLMRANIIFALSMVLKAKEARNASIKNRYEFHNECAKFYARVFLQNIGWVGEYTKNCREHFMGHLNGSSRTVWMGANNPNNETEVVPQ